MWDADEDTQAMEHVLRAETELDSSEFLLILREAAPEFWSFSSHGSTLYSVSCWQSSLRMLVLITPSEQ